MKLFSSLMAAMLCSMPAYAFHPVAAAKHAVNGAVDCAKHPEKLAKSVASTSHDVAEMLVAQAVFNFEIAKKEAKFDSGLPMAAAKHVCALMKQ